MMKPMGILIIFFPDTLKTALLDSGILLSAPSNRGLFTENRKRKTENGFRENG
jgi:hypothetical protein